MAQIEGSGFCPEMDWEENLCRVPQPVCLACRPWCEDLSGVWQWGSRPGFLRTREDAVIQSFSIEIPARWEGREVTGFERFDFARSRVEEISFPEGIREISARAFNRTPDLNCLVLPSTLRKIGDWAFCRQERMRYLFLHEGLAELGEGAFAFCNGLRRVEFPASLQKIGPDAFAQDPVKREEPLTLLVPAFWRGGRLLRELTAPLDRGGVPYRLEYRQK